MMNAQLHRAPVAVDREQHRQARLRVPVTDWSVASRMNSIVVTGAEFGPACREYPVVFVNAGSEPDGKPMVMPIAVLGLAPQENLYVEPGGHWRASYLPMLLRAYPFGISRIDEQRFAVCVDTSYAGFAASGAPAEAGEALFGADGAPSELLGRAQKMLEQLELEIQRTRAFCRRLRELGLLRDMRLDAQMPAGQKVSVDGFMTVDEAKLRELPDATVLELHRSGLLALIHGHFLSLGHVQRLLDWRAVLAGAAPVQ